MIQNPTILLLDEATSALDSHSERLVQDALDKASKGRTTIVVSHRSINLYFFAIQIFYFKTNIQNRLSAIRNADRILFIEKGKIVEDGTHDELIKQQGSYYNMMRSNNIDNDNILQNTLDVDNENLPSSKLVEKQMFAESKQIKDNQIGSTVFFW